MQSASKLLRDLQDFNRKAESYQKGKSIYLFKHYYFFYNLGIYGISQDTLEHEAQSLDLKYNDLLNIFIETHSENK
jgi:hypothetical protein